MIELPISVLDIGFVFDGMSLRQSVVDTITLARHAEQLGFQRFWVTEHHGSSVINGAATSVMVGRLAAETTSIRVGAGGVMLPNHSPAAVAEQFGTLGALDPGRIDLGIGRGPGSFNADYIDALRLGEPPLPGEGYNSRVRQLSEYLRADEARTVRIALAEGFPPELWLLTSGAAGAALAAELGLPLSFAHHISPANTQESLDLYRAQFKPSCWLDRPRVMLAAGVVCGETDEVAAGLVRLAEQLRMRAISEQFAAQFGANVSAAQKESVRQQLPSLAGITPDSVRGGYACGGPGIVERQLARLVDRFAPDELILFLALGELKDQLRCIELISEIIRPVSPGLQSIPHG